MRYANEKSAYGYRNQWFINPDNPTQHYNIKTYDLEPFKDHAAYMRNEVKQTGALRKVLTLPISEVYKMMREGKLGEEAFVNGQIVIDEKQLPALMKEYSTLACVDKL